MTIIIELGKMISEQLLAIGFLIGIPLVAIVIASILTKCVAKKEFWILFFVILGSLVFSFIVYGLMIIK